MTILSCPEHGTPLAVGGNGMDGATVIVVCLEGGEEWSLRSMDETLGAVTSSEVPRAY